MEFYSIITNKGLDLITKALSNGTKLNLEYIAVGDSNGAYYEPNPNQTSLGNERYRAKISEVNNLKHINRLFQKVQQKNCGLKF